MRTKRTSMSVQRWTLAAMFAGLIGCASEPTGAHCPAEVVESTILAEMDHVPAEEGRQWSSTVDSLIANAPRDSLVTVAFSGLRISTDAFITVVEELGADVTYVFRTISAVAVNIPVAGLEAMTLRSELYVNISIGDARSDRLLNGSCP